MTEASIEHGRAREPASRAVLLALAAAIAAGNFLLLPLQVYLGNIQEYSTPAAQTVAILAGWAAVVFCLISVPGLLIPARARQWYCVLLLALAVAAYVQANFLVWDYGLLDGRELRWDANRTRGFLDLLVWAAVFATALIFRRRLLAHGALIAGCLIGIQTLAAALAFIQREEPPSHHFFTVSSDELVTFSPERNIVVLLLDEFQSNVFPELLAEDPELRERLDGFVYYPDAVAGYAKTMGSVPNILTGEFYDNQRPIADFLKESYSRSFLPMLKQAGYRVELYPITKKLLHMEAGLASNILPQVSASMFGTEAAGLLDTSLFRSLPHDLKRAVVGDGRWLVARLREQAVQTRRETRAASQTPDRAAQLIGETRFRDLDFHRALSLAGVSENRAPRFKFIHLQGPHEPFIYDADLSPRRLPHGREGYIRQARGALRILEDFLETLERLGVSDRTDVLVISDHGAGEYGISPPGVEGSAVPTFVRSSGLPLVMLRQAGGTGPLSTSGRPVALADVPGTIASLAGIVPPIKSGSLVAGGENGRTRMYYHYDFDGWDRRYLPPLVEYEVKGHSWESVSWRATGRVLQPGEPDRAQNHAASNRSGGVVHALGRGKPAIAFLGEGWADPEPNEVWTNGKRATLRFPVPGWSGPLRAGFVLRPFVVPGRVASQPVEVSVGGRRMAQWPVDQAGTFGVFVPPGTVVDGVLTINLVIPNAISPSEATPGSGDSRELGIAVNEISLEPLPDFPASGKFDFAPGGNAHAFLLWGWSNPDDDGTWTTGRTAGILIPGGPKGAKRRLSASVSPYLHQGDIRAQRVLVHGGAGEEESWNVAGGGQFNALIETNGDPWVVLEFTFPDAAAPIDHPTRPSPDLRKLALKFRSLVVGPAFGR